MITKEKAEKILDHLLQRGMGWCFYNGLLVSVEDCERIINNEQHIYA